MGQPWKIVYYVNQFYAGLGGEASASMCPAVVAEGPVGPAKLMQLLLGSQARVVATVACGDNFFAEHPEPATEELISIIKKYQPDVFVAGPAFNSGRYGLACGAVARAVQLQLKIPVLSGMSPENPAVEQYKSSFYIISTGDSAVKMKSVVEQMTNFLVKVMSGEKIGPPHEEGYIPQGVRKNFFHQSSAATRAVDMLTAKLSGMPFRTEVPLQLYEQVAPSPGIKDLSKALIALVSEAGLVPRGNPEHIEVARATKWAKQSVAGVASFTPEAYEPIHAGYDHRPTGEDPNRMVPMDALRDLEKEGMFGRLFDYYYYTSGANSTVMTAQRFGREIANDLLQAGVQGAILTST